MIESVTPSGFPRRLGVRAGLALLLLAVLASACHQKAVATQAVPVSDGLLVLAVGQAASFSPAGKLRFVRIVSDSRCPAGEQCIWAGEVTIELSLAIHDTSTTFELSERKSRAVVQSVSVELLSYGNCPGTAPVKAATAKGAKPADECASLRVGKDSEY